MTARAQQHTAQVLRRTRVSAHLVRLVLGGPGLAGFTSTGIPDEWVGLVVPDQFQSRYYTVRSWRDGELTLDVVLHDVGLVTEWARRDCVGETVVVTDPKGSFAPPADAGWLILVGDLTALPAMARILETTDLPTTGLGRGRRPPRRLPARRRRRHLADAARRGAQPPRRRGHRRSTGPRATATSGWRGSPRRCGRSAST